MIEVSRLKKTYLTEEGVAPAVMGISFQVGRGEFYTFTCLLKDVCLSLRETTQGELDVRERPRRVEEGARR